jgi:hypothetical protein
MDKETLAFGKGDGIRIVPDQFSAASQIYSVSYFQGSF